MLFHRGNQTVRNAATAALRVDPARRHLLLDYHFTDKHALGSHLKYLQREDDALAIPHLIAHFHHRYMRSDILSSRQRRDDERVLFFFCDLLAQGATAEQKVALEYVAQHGDARALPYLRRAAPVAKANGHPLRATSDKLPPHGGSRQLEPGSKSRSRQDKHE